MHTMIRYVSQLFCALWLGLVIGPAVAQPIDIQRVLPNGQLTRDIPAGEAITLRVSGTWHDRCTPSVVEFARNGTGRLLQLLHNRALFIFCAQVLTPFHVDISNVRFDEDEIGLLTVNVINSHFAPTLRVETLSQELTILNTVSLAIQPPASRRVAVWPTARNPPPGLYPVTPNHVLDGGWYSPMHSGSGLLLSHTPRRAGDAAGNIDELWGTWANFATDGKPQWHLLSETYWASPTRLLGRVYRASSDEVACTLQFPNPECTFAARKARRVDPVGIFELNVVNEKELVMTIDDSGTPLLLGMVQPAVVGYRVSLRRL